MSNENSKRPSHYLYVVTEREGSDKGFWTRIGAAFQNGDAKGWNVQLNALPVDGRLVMREPKEEGAEK